MTARKTTAREVRTGDIIQTTWSRIHDRNLTLTVEYPTYDRFDSPGVGVIDRVRFTGVDNYGKRRENIMGCGPNDRVYVVSEAPRDGDTFGALSEWIDPAYEPPEDAWLDAGDSLEVL